METTRAWESSLNDLIDRANRNLSKSVFVHPDGLRWSTVLLDAASLAKTGQRANTINAIPYSKRSERIPLLPPEAGCGFCGSPLPARRPDDASRPLRAPQSRAATAARLRRFQATVGPAVAAAAARAAEIRAAEVDAMAEYSAGAAAEPARPKTLPAASGNAEVLEERLRHAWREEGGEKMAAAERALETLHREMRTMAMNAEGSSSEIRAAASAVQALQREAAAAAMAVAELQQLRDRQQEWETSVERTLTALNHETRVLSRRSEAQQDLMQRLKKYVDREEDRAAITAAAAAAVAAAAQSASAANTITVGSGLVLPPPLPPPPAAAVLPRTGLTDSEEVRLLVREEVAAAMAVVSVATSDQQLAAPTPRQGVETAGVSQGLFATVAAAAAAAAGVATTAVAGTSCAAGASGVAAANATATMTSASSCVGTLAPGKPQPSALGPAAATAANAHRRPSQSTMESAGNGSSSDSSNRGSYQPARKPFVPQLALRGMAAAVASAAVNADAAAAERLAAPRGERGSISYATRKRTSPERMPGPLVTPLIKMFDSGHARNIALETGEGAAAECPSEGAEAPYAGSDEENDPGAAAAADLHNRQSSSACDRQAAAAADSALTPTAATCVKEQTVCVSEGYGSEGSLGAAAADMRDAAASDASAAHSHRRTISDLSANDGVEEDAALEDMLLEADAEAEVALLYSRKSAHRQRFVDTALAEAAAAAAAPATWRHALKLDEEPQFAAPGYAAPRQAEPGLLQRQDATRFVLQVGSREHRRHFTDVSAGKGSHNRLGAAGATSHTITLDAKHHRHRRVFTDVSAAEEASWLAGAAAAAAAAGATLRSGNAAVTDEEKLSNELLLVALLQKRQRHRKQFAELAGTELCAPTSGAGGSAWPTYERRLDNAGSADARRPDATTREDAAAAGAVARAAPTAAEGDDEGESDDLASSGSEGDVEGGSEREDGLATATANAVAALLEDREVARQATMAKVDAALRGFADTDEESEASAAASQRPSQELKWGAGGGGGGGFFGGSLGAITLADVEATALAAAEKELEAQSNSDSGSGTGTLRDDARGSADYVIDQSGRARLHCAASGSCGGGSAAEAVLQANPGFTLQALEAAALAEAEDELEEGRATGDSADNAATEGAFGVDIVIDDASASLSELAGSSEGSGGSDSYHQSRSESEAGEDIRVLDGGECLNDGGSALPAAAGFNLGQVEAVALAEAEAALAAADNRAEAAGGYGGDDAHAAPAGNGSRGSSWAGGSDIDDLPSIGSIAAEDAAAFKAISSTAVITHEQLEETALAEAEVQLHYIQAAAEASRRTATSILSDNLASRARLGSDTTGHVGSADNLAATHCQADSSTPNDSSSGSRNGTSPLAGGTGAAVVAAAAESHHLDLEAEDIETDEEGDDDTAARQPRPRAYQGAVSAAGESNRQLPALPLPFSVPCPPQAPAMAVDEMQAEDLSGSDLAGSESDEESTGGFDEQPVSEPADRCSPAAPAAAESIEAAWVAGRARRLEPPMVTGLTQEELEEAALAEAEVELDRAEAAESAAAAGMAAADAAADGDGVIELQDLSGDLFVGDSSGDGMGGAEGEGGGGSDDIDVGAGEKQDEDDDVLARSPPTVAAAAAMSLTLEEIEAAALAEAEAELDAAEAVGNAAGIESDEEGDGDATARQQRPHAHHGAASAAGEADRQLPALSLPLPPLAVASAESYSEDLSGSDVAGSESSEYSTGILDEQPDPEDGCSPAAAAAAESTDAAWVAGPGGRHEPPMVTGLTQEELEEAALAEAEEELDRAEAAESAAAAEKAAADAAADGDGVAELQDVSDDRSIGDFSGDGMGGAEGGEGGRLNDIDVGAGKEQDEDDDLLARSPPPVAAAAAMSLTLEEVEAAALAEAEADLDAAEAGGNVAGIEYLESASPGDDSDWDGASPSRGGSLSPPPPPPPPRRQSGAPVVAAATVGATGVGANAAGALDGDLSGSDSDSDADAIAAVITRHRAARAAATYSGSIGASGRSDAA